MNTRSRQEAANFKAWEIEMTGRSLKVRTTHYITQFNWYYRAMIKRWNNREN